MRGAWRACDSGLRGYKLRECIEKLTNYLLWSVNRKEIRNLIHILFTITHLYLELIDIRALVSINRSTIVKL